MSLQIPTTMNLGSGRNFHPDQFNIDINEIWKPDAILDFGKPLPFGENIETTRFSSIELKKNFFKKIVCNDVLEHIPDLVTAMKNALDILEIGGSFEISVPYDLSLGAWQDPTHVRAFNENSWIYYCDWFWYLGWTEARFEQTHLQVTFSEIGSKLAQEGYDLKKLMRTPRAIDSMQVKLKKVILNESDRENIKKFHRTSQ